MRKILLLLSFALLCFDSCHKSGWKTVKIGTYLIDIPDSCNLKLEHGIDSEPGEIHCKAFDISFDYGRYTDTLNQTVPEYLKLGWWRDLSATRFMPRNVPYDDDFAHIKVQSIRPAEKKDSILFKGCDYVAECVFKRYHIKLPIKLPPEVKNYTVKIDTLDNQVRRLVQSKVDPRGLIGIYMGDVRRKITSNIMYNTIVFEANKLNANQRKLVLQIFLTLRHQK
jgi:hypothetical protein